MTLDGTPRRDFLKQAGLAALLAGVDPFRWLTPAHAEQHAIELNGTRLDLLRLMGRGFDRNTLKLFAAAADPVRNRVYVAGIMTRYVSVLDGSTHAALATVDTGISEHSYKYLAIDTAANRLYVRDTLNSRLSAVDLGTGAISGPVALPQGLGGMIADAARGLVYVTTTAAPGFRIYDGVTLAPVASISSMGNALPSMVHDSDADVLYLLDSSQGIGRIYRMTLADRAITTISFSVSAVARPGTLARSRSTGRFYVVSGGGITVLGADGRTERTLSLPGFEFQDMNFNDADGRLLVLFLQRPENGEVAASGARLFALAGNNWGEIASFGRKPHTIAINSATGRFYCPAGDDSTVWWGAADSNQIGALRIGDSVEHMVVSPADGIVYLNSRLGGSYLAAYDPATGTAAAFSAGTWPTGMEIDSTGRRLVVLNAWDSTLSVFELPARRLLATIALGLPRGTTDRLPDLAVDFARDRAYAAYPEFGQVAVVDLANGRALSSFSVDGFATGDVDGGPNQIQLAVSESAARLLVMSPSLRRLEVYDISGSLSRVAQTTLPASVMQGGDRLPWKLLFVDGARDRAFIGNAEYDVRTGRATGTQLARGQRVFASDDTRSVYWTGAVENGAINLYTFDRTSLSQVETYAAGAADVLAPGFAVDATRGRLFVTHLAAAQFDQYALAGGSGPGPGSSGAPSQLTASVSGSTVTFTWAPPSGSAPTGYLLDAGSAAGSSNLGSFPIGGVTMFSATAPAGVYFVRVRAVTAAGTSAASNEVRVTVGVAPGNCMTAPLAPNGFNAAVAGRTVTFGWTAPAGAPTSYQLEAGSASGLSNLAVLNTASSAATFAVLAPPGRYFVRLRAINACGTGQPTADIVVTVT